MDEIDRWVDEHCLNWHHISSCYFQPNDKELVREGENKGKMGGKEIKWGLRGKRRKERERDEWASDAWRKVWKRQG